MYVVLHGLPWRAVTYRKQAALYGAVFYFDHEEDYVRCRTMAESFTVLEPLLSVEIPYETSRIGFF